MLIYVHQNADICTCILQCWYLYTTMLISVHHNADICSPKCWYMYMYSTMLIYVLHNTDICTLKSFVFTKMLISAHRNTDICSPQFWYLFTKMQIYIQEKSWKYWYLFVFISGPGQLHAGVYTAGQHHVHVRQCHLTPGPLACEYPVCYLNASVFSSFLTRMFVVLSIVSFTNLF